MVGRRSLPQLFIYRKMMISKWCLLLLFISRFETIYHGGFWKPVSHTITKCSLLLLFFFFPDYRLLFYLARYEHIESRFGANKLCAHHSSKHSNQFVRFSWRLDYLLFFTCFLCWINFHIREMHDAMLWTPLCLLFFNPVIIYRITSSISNSF